MPSSGAVQFELLHVDRATGARRGRLTTPHGAVQTPAFMPVGTQGTVKGLTVDQLRRTGAEMVLGNTYHLALRPGEDVVAQLGGLHRFMDWEGPILTDSGGFQIYSLAERTVADSEKGDRHPPPSRGAIANPKRPGASPPFRIGCKITEEGASFQSHIDGSRVEISPERAVAIQEALGSDIAMVLDHVVGLPAEERLVREATERSVRWAERCRDAHTREGQAQFAIVQGGLDAELRKWSARELVKLDFPGYAVGGLSVGEDPADMYRMLDVTVPELPADRPRYLMGVGRPQDLIEGVRRGIDLFDCVMPTRNGRNALAFTDEGTLRLRNLQYQTDARPLEAGCPCAACRHSRGYLRHLFQAGEMLGPILLSIHNLTHYQRLMERVRRAIEEDRFAQVMASGGTP